MFPIFKSLVHGIELVHVDQATGVSGSLGLYVDRSELRHVSSTSGRAVELRLASDNDGVGVWRGDGVVVSHLCCLPSFLGGRDTLLQSVGLNASV